MAIGVIHRLELNQKGLDVCGINLPVGPEASGADVREGQGLRLDQTWR